MRTRQPEGRGPCGSQAVHGRFLRFGAPFGAVKDDVRCWITGKRVVDFLLVLIEFFSLGIMDEVLRVKIDRKSAISLQRGHFELNFR